MNKDHFLTIDHLDENNVILLDGSNKVVLPISFVPGSVNVGDQFVLLLHSKDEYEKSQHDTAQGVLQELLKEK
jgi:hypothetical protein